MLLEVLGDPTYVVVQLSAEELREKLLLTNRTLKVAVRSLLKVSKEELLKIYDEFIEAASRGEQGKVKGVMAVWQIGDCTITFNGHQLKLRSCELDDRIIKILEVIKGSTMRAEFSLT